MPIQRRGKAWFTLSKVVIDDYAARIGAHGLAVYACLVRMGEDHDEGHFEIEDLGKMLGLEQSEVATALEALVKAGVLTRETIINGNETTDSYLIKDLAEEYYGPSAAMPEPIIQSIPEKPSRGCKGFVYVVEGGGYFKIGCTTDLAQRIKALTVKAPFTLDVQLVIPSLDIYTTEQELHRRFAKKHRRGEWFDLDIKDIEDIRNDYPLLDPAFLTTE
jgi:hypothetical protein